MKLKNPKSNRLKNSVIALAIVDFVLISSFGGFVYAQSFHKNSDKKNLLQNAQRTQIIEEKNIALSTVKREQPKKAPIVTPPAATVPSVVSAPKSSAQTTYKKSIPKRVASAPTSLTAASSVEDEILRLVNSERASNGVGVLTHNATLRQAAGVRVLEESITSFAGCDHTRPNGSAFNTAYNQVGYTGYTAWAENLITGYQSPITYNQTNLKALALKMFTGWRNSPGHYANMINGNYNQTGIGVNLIVQNGRLYYFGIQDFAKR